MTSVLAFVFLLSIGAKAVANHVELPRPVGEAALPFPLDQDDFWDTLNDTSHYATQFRDGAALEKGTVEQYLKLLVDRACANVSLSRVSCD